jgi:NADH-quinone oxidoreductase subunit M
MAGFKTGTTMTFLLMSGFLLAFAVKIPSIPFHTWLPDAHTEAPTAGSLILAGLLLKTGAYGVIRFVLILFPSESISISPYAMLLGVIGILYGAKLAFAQTDLKRMVAYTSISHMGFVILGIYSFNEIAMKGVVMQMIAHAISTGALFIIAGIIQERIHSRDFSQMGGLWDKMPALGGIGMVFVMASLGLPGLANFIAEFMILLGSFQSYPLMSVLASLGLIVSVIYALRIMQKVFLGPGNLIQKIRDINIRESIILGMLIIPAVYLGLFPGIIFKTLDGSHMEILMEEDHTVEYKIAQDTNHSLRLQQAASYILKGEEADSEY